MSSRVFPLFMITVMIICSTGVCLPEVEEVIDFLDRLYRSEDSYAEMSMHIVTPHWERTLTMKAWSQGSDRTFIRILSPAREAGMATLRVGTEMWNYLPNTSSTVRVPPSMMTGSWMGSDITNNDIVKEITYLEDYTFSYTTDTTLTGSPEEGLAYILLEPRPSTAVVWSAIVCAIGQEDMLPRWENYLDQNGDEIKRITFSDVREIGGRTIPTVMEVIPTNSDAQSTTITWTHAEFDQGVSDDIFTLSNLQSGDTE